MSIRLVKQIKFKMMQKKSIQSQGDEDQLQIDQKNLNIGIDGHVEKENCTTSLNIIWRYSNRRFDYGNK